MALDRDQLKLDVAAAVKAAYEVEFDAEIIPDPITEDFISTAMGKVAAAGTDVIVGAIINDAEVLVTDVTPGVGTAPGTIS